MKNVWKIFVLIGAIIGILIVSWIRLSVHWIALSIVALFCFYMAWVNYRKIKKNTNND